MALIVTCPPEPWPLAYVSSSGLGVGWGMKMIPLSLIKSLLSDILLLCNLLPYPGSFTLAAEFQCDGSQVPYVFHNLLFKWKRLHFDCLICFYHLPSSRMSEPSVQHSVKETTPDCNSFLKTKPRSNLIHPRKLSGQYNVTIPTHQGNQVRKTQI